MKKIFYLILLFAFGVVLTGLSEKTNDPLPDYVAQFNEADALIRGIDSTTPCTNYYRWVWQAVFAKDKLKLKHETGPWLEELSTAYTNNWRILHAAAYGRTFLSAGSYKENRWNTVQLMDRAHRLLQTENPPPDQATCFYDDYISMLISTDTPYLLQLKTTALSCSDWLKASDDLEQQMEQLPVNDPVFFNIPTSYETAANDGELIRWLFCIKPRIGKTKLTLPDFAVLTVGTHINVPLQRRPNLDTYDREPPPYARDILATLKDNETIVWGAKTNDYRIVGLPEDYQYISAYMQQAAQGDISAADTLADIFLNRCQLERAAHWFDTAGRTNKVRDIRANQGIFLPHGRHICCKPINIAYVFRNGSEVEFEIYPINAGSNLLSRLITKQVNGTEIKLLDGKPNDFHELHEKNYAGLLGERLHHWTLPLSPPPDHRDAKQTVDLPALSRGNYLLRATMKDGNQTETILHVFDTVLYQALYFDPDSYNLYYNSDEKFNFLCDALTGEPKRNHELHLCQLSGGIRIVDKKKEDGPHILEQYILRYTADDGTVGSVDIARSWWRAIDITPYQSPFITHHQTPFVSNTDAYELKIYNREDRDNNWHGERADFITTDRPVYRPGDTGYLKLWYKNSRHQSHLPLVEIESQRNNYSLPMEINPALKDGEEKHVDPFGGVDYTFTIPENAPLGGYRCDFSTSRYGYQADFLVEKYRAPEFKIEAQLNADKDNIEIAADYTYGKSLTSGTVSGQLSFEESHTHWFYPSAPLDAAWGKGYWWNGAQFSQKQKNDRGDDLYCHASFTNQLDETGRTWIDISTVSNATEALARPGYFELSLTATDPAEKQLNDWLIVPTASAKGPEFCCWLDQSFYSITETIVCRTASQNPDEPLHLQVSSLTGTNTVQLQNIPLTQQTVTLNSLPGGTYIVRLLNESGAASQPFEFAVIDDTAPFDIDIERKTTDLTEDNPIRLIVEKGLYHRNDLARILIQVDRPGRYVYWFPRAINNLGFNRPEVFQMETVSKVVELPLIFDQDKGIIQSAAFTIVNGTPHIANCNLTIQSPELDAGTIELNPDKPTYKPDEKVSLDIRTLESSGKGRSCSVTLTVYNKSLDLWASLNPPKIVNALFSRWHNCKNQTVSTSGPYSSPIEAIHPKWVMESILPSGYAPVFMHLSLPCISSMSCFGSAMSVGDGDPLDEEDSDSDNVRIREDFRDLAYWNATIITDSNGCASVSFPMPDGLMEWKIKAWAMHTNYAAEAETSIRCAKDFVAQLNTPRFMVEGDELECSASIRNHTTNTISCVAGFTMTGEGLQSESPAERTINELEAGAATMAYWNTRATATGTAGITTTVIGGSESDGMKIDFRILPHGLLKRGGHGGVLAGSKTSETVKILIPEAIDLDTLNVRLHTTPNMLKALTGALPFLADYPYGCTEQTLNRFLPSLVVMQTMNELGIDSLTAATNMPPDRQSVLDPKEIRKRAQAGIDRLTEAVNCNARSLRLFGSGEEPGWGWSMDSGSPRDALITAWVLRGLHIASKVNELNVHDAVLDSMKEYLLNEMAEELEKENSPTNSVEICNTDAFLTFSLAETGIEGVEHHDDERGEAFTNDKNRKTLLSYLDLLFNHADQLSLYGKILLANAYAVQDLEAKRDQLMAFVEQYLEHNPSTGEYWLRTRSDNEYWYWYNDDIELHAWYLKLLNRIDPHGEKTAGIARYLMQNRIYGNHWKSTRDTAICIEALAEFAKNNHTDTPEEVISISLNGQELSNPEEAQLALGTNTLVITSEDGAPIFFDATWQYYSKENPITPESCDLVSITRSYSSFGANTNIVIRQGEAVQTGETLEVKLTINANQPLEYLLAEDRKPAGFETVETESGYYRGSFREFHDERVSFYLSRIPKGETVLTYRMRAEHAGKVSALPATVELMYEPRQAANTAEEKLHTLRQQTSL